MVSLWVGLRDLWKNNDRKNTNHSKQISRVTSLVMSTYLPIQKYSCKRECYWSAWSPGPAKMLDCAIGKVWNNLKVTIRNALYLLYAKYFPTPKADAYSEQKSDAIKYLCHSTWMANSICIACPNLTNYSGSFLRLCWMALQAKSQLCRNKCCDSLGLPAQITTKGTLAA